MQVVLLFSRGTVSRSIAMDDGMFSLLYRAVPNSLSVWEYQYQLCFAILSWRHDMVSFSLNKEWNHMEMSPVQSSKLHLPELTNYYAVSCVFNLYTNRILDI